MSRPGPSLDRERRENTARLAVGGELDGEAAKSLTHRVGTLLDGGPAELVLDMSGVTRCGPAGIAALFTTYSRAEQLGARLTLRHLDAPVYRAGGS